MAFLAPIGTAIAGAFGGGGSLFNALGAVVTAGSGLAAASYQAQVAKANASIAEQNAQRAVTQGNKAAQEQDNLTRAAIGEQIAVQSASGLSLNSKSQMLTRKAARALGRQDSINAREAGDINAYNYRTDAMNFESQAAGAKLAGTSSLLSGVLDFGGSLIGNARSTRRSFAPNPTPRPRSLLS